MTKHTAEYRSGYGQARADLLLELKRAIANADYALERCDEPREAELRNMRRGLVHARALAKGLRGRERSCCKKCNSSAAAICFQIGNGWAGGDVVMIRDFDDLVSDLATLEEERTALEHELQELDGRPDELSQERDDIEREVAQVSAEIAQLETDIAFVEESLG